MYPRRKPVDFYKFVINDRLFPDPAAPAQYGGPHGPSMIIDSDDYTWQDEHRPLKIISGAFPNLGSRVTFDRCRDETHVTDEADRAHESA